MSNIYKSQKAKDLEFYKKELNQLLEFVETFKRLKTRLGYKGYTSGKDLEDLVTRANPDFLPYLKESKEIISFMVNIRADILFFTNGIKNLLNDPN